MMCGQYIGGCSVRRGCLSTQGGGSVQVHRRDIMIHVGDIMSTSGGGGGVVFVVHWRDTLSTSGDLMIHVGEEIDSSIDIENPDVLILTPPSHAS